MSDDQPGKESAKGGDNGEQSRSNDGQTLVVEAEIVSEDNKRQRDDDKSRTTGSSPRPAPKRPNWAARVGWSLFIALALFVGGIVAQPYLYPQLAFLGLVPAKAEDPQAPVQDFSGRLEAVEAQQARLQARLDDIASRPPSDGSAQIDAGRLNDLENRIAALDARISARRETEEDPSPGAIGLPQQQAADLQTQQSRLNDLEARFDSLEEALTTRLATRADQDRVQALASELARQRLELADLKDRASTQAQALTDLGAEVQQGPAQPLTGSGPGRTLLLLTAAREAALAGDDFTDHLAAVDASLSSLPADVARRLQPGLEALTGMTDPVLWTFAEFEDRFQDAALKAIEARDRESGRFLAGLFTSRRKDTAEGLEGRLNAAERQLESRDLAAASETVLGLEGAPAEAFTAWQQAARQRIAVTAAFRRLIDDIGRIGPQSGDAAPEPVTREGAGG